METLGEVTQTLFNEVIQTLINKDLGDVLEKTEKCVERKEEFIRRFVLMLSDCINSLSKDAKICSNGGWPAIDARWHELNTKIEIWNRRIKLLTPSTVQDFKATLWWMAERGVEEDLGLIRQVEKAPPFPADDIVRLLEIAKERISERVDDPHYVLRKGEEAYQRNKKEWDQEYAGQFIAIHRGEVVDSDPDKSMLIERLIKAQKEKGPFRAYIVKVGAPVLRARGPRVRLRLREK